MELHRQGLPPGFISALSLFRLSSSLPILRGQFASPILEFYLAPRGVWDERSGEHGNIRASAG
jgi:hypothetical protein